MWNLWNLWEAFRGLEQRVQRLEYENQELREQVEKAKRPFKVKKVVYHVHNLTIREMKGTMNIGLIAPLDEEEMEQIEVEMTREKQ